MPHRPRKRFSQNFLIDETAIADIVAAVGPRAGDRMVEIGPGLAAITRPLAQVVQPLHVVEIDRDIVARLRNDFAPERLIIHEGDALDFDFAALGPDLRVVGNLPYHISTPILFHLADCTHALRDIHVMLQAEVVERMTAVPGSSEYGRLSVMLQYRFDLEKVLDVSAEAFQPAPKVESAVVRMSPHPATGLRALDDKMLEQTVAMAFSQRRKTLRNTLGGVLGKSDFETLDIDPQARAQTLSVQEFVNIADYRAGLMRPSNE
ncbi:MAG TPA: 16S rRNA (adenine(1518)-N(6)/adenine(1519)-N(6))-dimethyltransferase RsmA [Burkholderiales bacterium]|jgi:16S rRNA (adenine1518-N6/adenine1519-N6)-dimethyltransferase|nr:16S rRNA (adenine(1518)-N(6)/adenine(1519)-N(6))-dimethyltransferase RsmA [Burkholderiales bacterium]